MPLYEIDGNAPTLGEGAWVAPSADLIGDVRLGARASVWFGADDPRRQHARSSWARRPISRTARSAIPTPARRSTIGARVTVGHQAILHGCTVEDEALIGMGARILNGAVIGAQCIVGAGALVTEGKNSSRAA